MIAVNIPTMETAELTKEQCADMIGVPHDFCLKSLVNWFPTEEKPYVFFFNNTEAMTFIQSCQKS